MMNGVEDIGNTGRFCVGGKWFSPRHIDVVSCLSNGMSHKITGDILGVSSKTVSGHVRCILKMFNRSDIEYVINYFFAHGASAFLSARYHYLMFSKKLRDELRRLRVKSKYANVAIYYYPSESNFASILSNYLVEINCRVESVDLDRKDLKGIADDSFIKIMLDKTGDFDASTGKFNYVFNLKGKGFLKECFKLFDEICDGGLSEDMSLYEKADNEYTNIKFYDNTDLDIMEKKMQRKKKLAYVSAIALCSVTLVYGLYPNFRDETYLLDPALVILNDVYLERSVVFKDMDKIFSDKSSLNIVALIGPGGAGKTTVARKYAHRCKKKYNSRVCAEINAESQEAIYSSFCKLAHGLSHESAVLREDLRLIESISDQKEKNTQIICFVMKNLKKINNWTLIFDNVNDLQSISEVVPVSSELWGAGRVIITTRNQDIQDSQVPIQCITLGELSDDDKYSLFEQAYNKSNKESKSIPYTKEQVLEFLKEIPGYPLDIATVGCYIGSTNISIHDYSNRMLSMQNGSNGIDPSLFSDSTKYGKTRYGIVILTLQKMLNELKIESSKELFLLISMCDSQDIPVKLLEKCSSPREADLVIKELKKHSFITVKGEKLSIHRSVQELWMHALPVFIEAKNMEQLLSVFCSKAVNFREVDGVHYKVIPTETDEWYKCMMPHMKRVKDIVDKLQLSAEKKARYKAYIAFAMAIFCESTGYDTEYVISLFREAIDLDRQYNLFSVHDRSVLIGECGRVISYDDLSEGMPMLKRSLELAHLVKKDSEPLVIQRMIEVGSAEIKSGNKEYGMGILNAALNTVPKEQSELWMKKSYFQASYMVQKYKLLNNICNKKVILSYLDDFSHFLELSRLYGRIEDPFFVWHRNASIAYNVLERYEDVRAVYEKIEKLYIEVPESSVRVRLYVMAEYGKSLIRSGKLEHGDSILEKAMTGMAKISAPACDRTPAISSFMESKIKLSKYAEAMKAFVGGINVNYNPKESLEKLEYTGCLYNAGYASYKLGKIDDSLKYFGRFMQSIHELCGRFLSQSDRLELEKSMMFGVQDDAKKYIKNAACIYAKIFGQNAFVRDYISKNVE